MAPRDNSPTAKPRNHHERIWLLLIGLETIYTIVQLALLATLWIVNKNYLWVIINLIIVFLDFLVSATHLAYLERGGLDEITVVDLVPCLQLASFACNSYLRRRLWIWLIWKNVFWALLFLLWIKPAFLYTDAFGGTFVGATSLSGRSSCSRVTFYQEFGQCKQNFPGAGGGIVFHPEGAFSINNGFQLDGIYSRCFLEQEWAGPSFNQTIWLGGFARGVDGLNICSEPRDGGVVSRYNCPTSQQVCLEGYPGLWYGLSVQTNSPLVLANSTHASLPNVATVAYCPGNSAALVNFSTSPTTSQWVGGKPYPVCSFCLWYNIYQNMTSGKTVQVSDEVLKICLPGWNGAVNYPPDSYAGWRSYDDGTTDPSWLCGFCPGRGSGWWGFSTEVYDNNGIQESYWLYTSLALIDPGVRGVIFGFILFVEGALRCCKDRRQKAKVHHIQKQDGLLLEEPLLSPPHPHHHHDHPSGNRPLRPPASSGSNKIIE